MKYLGIFGLVSLLIVVFIISYLAIKSYGSTTPATEVANQTQAMAAAKALYLQRQSQGIDFSSGPCLADEIIPDWAADIVHNPRQSIDDLPQNQCSSFLEGKVKHFVELDSNGSLIRAE